jgi:hypothetical protein
MQTFALLRLDDCCFHDFEALACRVHDRAAADRQSELWSRPASRDPSDLAWRAAEYARAGALVHAVAPTSPGAPRATSHEPRNKQVCSHVAHEEWPNAARAKAALFRGKAQDEKNRRHSPTRAEYVYW